MHRTILAAATLALLAAPAAGEDAPPPGYDAALAAELGADDYGMRKYILVLLRTGPADIADPDRRRELFAGHFANMARLAGRGELVLAGPLSGEDDKRGLFILNAENIDAAAAMVAADPAVAAGVFIAEYNELYGSAAIMRINDLHARIQRKTIE